MTTQIHTKDGPMTTTMVYGWDEIDLEVYGHQIPTSSLNGKRLIAKANKPIARECEAETGYNIGITEHVDGTVSLAGLWDQNKEFHLYLNLTDPSKAQAMCEAALAAWLAEDEQDDEVTPARDPGTDARITRREATMTRICLNLPDYLFRRLKQASAAEDRTMTQILVRALRAYFTQDPPASEQPTHERVEP